MTVTLSPPMMLQFQNPNNSGAPAAGFKLFTYLAGSSTKQATWTDSTQATQNSNPVVLDSNGAWTIWGDPTLAYKFVLAPASDTDPPTSPVRTVDNLYFPITINSGIALGSYAITTAETAAAVTPANLSYLPYDVRRYGAQQSNLSAQNLAALNTAIRIATFDVGAASLGGVVITVPASCHYGYQVTNLASYPQFSGTTPITVYDYSQGESYSGYPVQYDGDQVRIFTYTPQTSATITFTASIVSGATSATLALAWSTPTGLYQVTFSDGEVRPVQLTLNATTATWTPALTNTVAATASYINPAHNGNGLRIIANWYPYIWIDNSSGIPTTSTGGFDNRRANILFGADGSAMWSAGMGGLVGAGFSLDQLSNFTITAYAAPGSAITTYVPLIIERATGNWSLGKGANTPGVAYLFTSVTTGFAQGCFENPFATTSTLLVRNSAGSGSDIALVNRAGQACINIAGAGDAATFDTVTRRATFISTQKTVVQPTYGATIAINNNGGDSFTITANNNTAFSISNPSGTTPTSAQRIKITIKNVSGGALGTATFDTFYRLAAWTQPANANSRSIDFEYYPPDNVWREVSRTPADVPN
jgi:hypothetical protein